MKMKDMYLRFCLLFSLALPCSGFTQSITGTWEGMMQDEWLEINIRQEGKKACGYTYDYILGNKRNFCRAYFEGYYDARMEYWVLNGTGFYENQGGHVLMTMKLWLDKSSRPYTLRGTVGIKSVLNSMFGLGSASPVALRRSSSTPKNIPGSESPCFEPKPVTTKPADEPKPNPPAPPKPPIPPVKPKQNPPANNNPTLPRKDSTPVAIIPDTPRPVIKTPVDIKPDQRLLARKNKEVKRLSVDVDRINLKVYDNGVIDNDTVSIYYNGKLLVNKQKLSDKAINIDLTLDHNAKQHTITMLAENLGSIPPNTALVVVTAGKKRYELFSSASLEENAVLVFDYVPD